MICKILKDLSNLHILKLNLYLKGHNLEDGFPILILKKPLSFKKIKVRDEYLCFKTFMWKITTCFLRAHSKRKTLDTKYHCCTEMPSLWCLKTLYNHIIWEKLSKSQSFHNENVEITQKHTLAQDLVPLTHNKHLLWHIFTNDIIPTFHIYHRTQSTTILSSITIWKRPLGFVLSCITMWMLVS